MKKSKNNDDFIIEDVIYYKKVNEIKNGGAGNIIENISKDTFYYQFLMERSDSSINGQNNYKAATDFYYYEEIFTYLLSLGILNNKEYCLDWTPIYGGATFSFNLSKAQRDLDVEAMLYEKFADKQMSDYIKTFCHPADGWRCDICGAVSLSRHLSFANENGEKLTYCLACHPINEEIKLKIAKVHNESGTYAAIKERLRFIEEATRVKIAPDKTINTLLDEFIANNLKWNKANPKVDVINRILEEAGRQEFDVFAYDDTGIAMINRKKLANIDIFSNSVALSDDGSEILVLFDRAGVSYTDKKCIDFVCRLTSNEELIKELKED